MTGEAVLVPFSAETERRRLTYERWLARSRLIRLARRALPVTIGVVLALIIGTLVVRGLLQRFGDVRGGAGLSIHMTNAQFFGRDKSGQPFVLSAAEAARDDRDIARIVLTKPQLVLDAGGPRSSRISARQGVYRQDDRIVRLWGGVTVRDGQGDVFVTERAIVDTIHNTVNGPAPVKGGGGMGSITAQSFAIIGDEQQVVLRGDVHSIIKQD
jgi:lipopolysaccharide export system protein LptC